MRWTDGLRHTLPEETGQLGHNQQERRDSEGRSIGSEVEGSRLIRKVKMSPINIDIKIMEDRM